MAGAAVTKGQQNVTRTRPHRGRDHVPASRGGHAQVEGHTHTGPCWGILWLLQLVAPVTLYPPLPNPSHGTSSQCGTIGLRSRLQRSIRGRRLRLMHPSVLPSPTSTLGCNTTWVNLHQPPSPPSSLELLCRNVSHPGTSVDGWAEVRHGPRNSHDRASKVLTD